MFVDLSDMMPYSLLYTYQTARYRTVSENTIIPKYHIHSRGNLVSHKRGSVCEGRLQLRQIVLASFLLFIWI
jgi:hypothetical protein